MPRQVPQFGWSEIYIAWKVDTQGLRQVPQFGRLEIWIVLQLGAHPGEQILFLIRMEGCPPNRPPFQIYTWF